MTSGELIEGRTCNREGIGSGTESWPMLISLEKMLNGDVNKRAN